MALLDSIIGKVVRPKSVTNPAFAEYEWLLEWYSTQGTPAQYMFTDWNTSERVDTNPINLETTEIKSIISNKQILVTLVAEDVKREDLPAFQSLGVSKNVARVSPDGTRERVAIRDSAIEWINSKQRFQIQITVQRKQPALII